MRRIQKQLAELRVRERILGLAWGGTFWLTLVVAALALACLIDWWVDRNMKTPHALRVGLFVTQLVLGSITAVWLLVLPLVRRLSDTRLALYVEEKLGVFGHRLISAVQFNTRSARTEGMSPGLIAAVTQQAEDQAAGLRFEQLADHRRLKKAIALFLTLAGIVTLAAILLPAGLLEVLLARQLLRDREIPRNVHIVSLNPDRLIWPGGEEVVLRFKVSGKFRPGDMGYLSVTALDRSRTDYYELRPVSGGPATEQEEVLYEARVAPGSVDFEYYARLRDGRTRDSAKVHYVSRPEIIAQTATVLLPDHYGKRPDGTSYFRVYPKGEVTEAVASSTIHVEAEVHKPVERAVLELLSSPTSSADETPIAPAIELRIETRVEERAGEKAEVCYVAGAFDLKKRPGAYRIRVWDEHDLANSHVKPRVIRIVPEAPPAVALLQEQLPPDESHTLLATLRGSRDLEAFDVSGHPVRLKGAIPIGYSCQGIYGLGQARLRYRLLRGREGEESGSQEGVMPERAGGVSPLIRGGHQLPDGEGRAESVGSQVPWSTYPLAQVSHSEARGQFIPLTGAFEKSSFMDQVHFYKVPSPQQEYLPDGLEGGGRFDFLTAALRHPDGQEVREGDRIQFFVEVSNRNPNAALDPNAWGRSEIRTKTFGSDKQIFEYVHRVLDEQKKLDQLERQQRDMWQVDLQQRKPFGDTPVAAGDGAQPVKVVGLRLATRTISRSPLTPSTDHSFTLENTGNDIIPLAKVTIRYWFTLNAGKQQVAELNLATAREAGGRVRTLVGQILATVGKPLRAGGDGHSARYLEISFRAGAGTLSPGGTVTMRCVRRHVDGSTINQSNDYSFDHALPMIAFDSPKVTAYLDGKLVWGMEPDGKGPAEDLKFGRSWLLVGPFLNPPSKPQSASDGKLIGRDIPYPPEKEPFAADKEFDGLKGKVRWQKNTFLLDRIDLDSTFNHREAGVAYALCWFRCNQPKAILSTGSDDGIKVWLNRKLVLDKAAHRDALPGDDKTPVDLASGWNEVLVKIDNKTDEWAFYLDLLDPKTGKPIPNIACRTSPPGEEPRNYAREWLVLGAFPNDNNTGLDKAFPPEPGKIKVDASYEGQGGKIHWRRHVSPQDTIELHNSIALPSHQPAVAYAACWVRSNRQQSAVASVGSTGGVKVWLDSKLVLNAQKPGDKGKEDDSKLKTQNSKLKTSPVALKAGWNEVLVKLERESGKWGFTFELRDPQSGQSLETIEYRAAPPHLDGKFVRSWQILGPFPNVNHLAGFQFPYPPERAPVDLKKDYAGTTGQVRWQPLVHNADRLDLRKYMPGVPPNQPGTAYLACWVRSDKGQMVQLATGSDGTLKVWLNRQMLFARGVHGTGAPGSDLRAVKLNAGWNEVLVKVGTHPASRWGLYFEFRSLDDALPLDGLEFRNTPPAGGGRKPVKPGVKPRPGRAEKVILRDWMVLGPFANPNQKSFNQTLPPETEKFDAKKEYQGSTGKVAWKAFQSKRDTINGLEVMRPGGQGATAAYAVCWVKVEQPVAASLLIGSDGGFKVWVNRNQALSLQGHRTLKPGSNSTAVQLAAGWNEILVKAGSNRAVRPWAFTVELRAQDGKSALEGVEIQGTPP